MQRPGRIELRTYTGERAYFMKMTSHNGSSPVQR
jgi:hypothetical protein